MATLLLGLSAIPRADGTFSNWDLLADASGNIAIATGAYAFAQDVASAERLFSGELWYDTTQGLPYFERILGFAPNPAFARARHNAAALTVPGIATVVTALDRVTKTRIQTGTISLTLTGGAQATITSTSVRPWYVSAFDPADEDS